MRLYVVEHTLAARRALRPLSSAPSPKKLPCAIAAPVSGSRASDVLSEGAERFRAIRLDAISTNG